MTNDTPSEKTVRDEIIEAGRRLYFKDLVAACDGNISARLSEDEFIVTPSGVSKGFMHADDLLKVNSRGELLEGDGKPTRELAMHLALYTARPDIRGVVHAHPPIATAFACTDRRFERIILPEVIFELGEIAVAEFALPSTQELPDSILAVLTKKTGAVLLSNHGAVTVGASVMKAYYNMETLEAVAKITLAAGNLGSPRYLSDSQVGALYELLEMGRTKSCDKS